MEPSPQPPLVFAGHAPTPYGDCENHLSCNDRALTYISSVLMEDDIDDKLLFQYSDHPELQQVQQPFAQILSSLQFSNIDNSPMMSSSPVSLLGVGRGNTEVSHGFLHGVNSDHCTLSSDLSEGADAVGAFLTGMEVASRLVPQCSIFRKDELVDQIRESSKNTKLKKRDNRNDFFGEDDEVRRENKSLMVMDEPAVSHGCESCIWDMQRQHSTMVNKASKKRAKSDRKAAKDGVDLHTLLVLCAQAVTTNNFHGAGELLKQIKQHASAKGDAIQRLAKCFAEGLEARLTGTGTQVQRLLITKRPSVMEFLKAYKLYMAASCFNKVAQNFNIMTILKVMEGKNRLHIVDFGLNFGLQWSGLLHSLANRDGGLPEVKITAIYRRQPRSYLPEAIEDTGHQLSTCAHKFGLPFKFHSIIADWETIPIQDLNIEANAVLVVNDLFNLSTLMDESMFFDDPSPRDTVLSKIRNMRPDVFIQSITNCSYGASFLTRFRQTLFYFTSLFDMLDATTSRESETRLMLEQGIFGRYVWNAIACEGVDLICRPEKYKQWQLRNQRAGLRQLPLNPNIFKVVREKVKDHHRDFLLSEDEHWLIQGWMGRILFAHSTWVAEDVPSFTYS